MVNVKSWTATLFLFFISTFALLAKDNDYLYYNHTQKPIINDQKKKNKFSVSRLNSSDLKINGKNYLEIPLGDSLEVTFSFFPGRQRAELSAYVDINNNGILDDSDKVIIKPVLAIDGDVSDLDKTRNGKYKTNFSYVTSDNIQLNSIIGRNIFIFVSDGIYQGIATLRTKAPASGFPVIGSISSPKNSSNLAVIATRKNGSLSQRYMAFTDINGQFHFELPYSNNSYYEFTSKDIFNTLKDTYFQPQPKTVIASDKALNLNLSYIEKTTFITGRLNDEKGRPVSNATIYAEEINPSGSLAVFTTKTGTDGTYSLGVMEGIYKVGINAESIFPNYLYADAIDSVIIKDAETLSGVNFSLYSTDRVISGRVTIDDKCAKDVYVAAWSNIGSVWQKTNSEGRYFLKVNGSSKYNIEVNPANIPSGHIALNGNFRNVSSESKDVNFIYAKAEIKIEGSVNDDSGHYPLQGVFIAATDGTHTFETETDDHGHYAFSALSGSYYISVSRGGQFYRPVDTMVIATSSIYHMNFYLSKQPEVTQNSDQRSPDLLIQHNNSSEEKPGTTLKYRLTENSHVVLQLFDATGNKIATLENRNRPAGIYEVNMNSLNLANGIYQCRLKAGSFSQTRKFIFIK